MLKDKRSKQSSQGKVDFPTGVKRKRGKNTDDQPNAKRVKIDEETKKISSNSNVINFLLF